MSEEERIRSIITPIAQDYGVKKIMLFGSRAKGSQTEHSDYDFLITKGNISSLLTYVSFVNSLEDALGTHVDVVTDTSSDQDFIDRINKEAVVIYEQ
ncbi:MAG: nucleotidyltransferase domain-containing protein [Anaerolineaceae bacterium]|nr:nucleotidyltransferase domain-containing protein [Anaerolineaceae bacterium]